MRSARAGALGPAATLPKLVTWAVTLKWQPTPVFLPEESQRQEPGGLPSMGSQRVGHD